MRGEVRRDQLGYRHGAPTGLGLGRPENEPTAALFGQLPCDRHGARLDADVGAPQSCQLAPSQTAENGEQHQGAVSVIDGTSCLPDSSVNDLASCHSPDSVPKSSFPGLSFDPELTAPSG